MTKSAGLLDLYFTVRMGLELYAISAGQEAATRPRSGRVARRLLLPDGRRGGGACARSAQSTRYCDFWVDARVNLATGPWSRLDLPASV